MDENQPESLGPSPAKTPPLSRGSELPTLDPASLAKDDLQVSPGDLHTEGFDTAPPSADERPLPPRIGQYRLIQIVGEGGFGTVWIADQLEPVKRRVAFKIIRAGMDSRAVIARFEQERQALALMDHPNIARVFDAGTAPDGRPYFVMEYVAGESITAFADRYRLNVRQRLEIFLPVCDAVQHAHHKGIIHRDLKPGNVLIASMPGHHGSSLDGAVVKVIDFGVAKAVHNVLTDKTVMTEMGQILGTPEYMSPEQADIGAVDIDTRTDVYALGVMLYELLVGGLPFEPQDLRSHGYNEIQRIIREVDPPRPSNRLKSMGAAPSAEIGRLRQMKAQDLEGQLRRELEWIPLKAMRKDRDERYATPNALADDIRNHLQGKPLTAGPETVMYKAKKFVYRNRWGVSAAAMVAMALVAGAIVSTIGFVRAAQNTKLAAAQRDRAKAEAAKSRLMQAYVDSWFSSADPRSGEKKDVTVRTVLDNAAKELNRGAQLGSPELEALMRSSLAKTYQSLALLKQSEEQWSKAVEREAEATGPESLDSAVALVGLGHIKIEMGQLDEAQQLLDHALSIQREQLPADDSQIGDTINRLGLLAQTRGDYKLAEQRYREALKIYQQHAEYAGGLPDAMANLGTILHMLGDDQQAIDYSSRALDLRRKLFGPENLEVWNSLTNIASMQESTGDLPGAVKTRRHALAIATSLLDDKNSKTIQSNILLARTLWLSGGSSVDEAQSLTTHAIDLAMSAEGPDSVLIAQAKDVLGNIARDRGQLDRAVQLFREALAIRTKSQSADHIDTAGEMAQLADALTRSGQASEAIDLASRAVAIRKSKLPAGHWAIASASSILGGAYAAAGDFTKAEPILLDAFKALENSQALAGRTRLDAAKRLVTLYEKWGKPEQAQLWQKRALSMTPAANSR